MSKIRVLSDHLANQIAAGEVVERPASVAKELVENSIDAGARRIEVDIEGGGRRLLRVADDGEGMTRDDAILAFERHATSKINSTDDLARIKTLGFRGEALASIASIARVELLTKCDAEPVATRVQIEGGRMRDVEPAAHPGGTTITARDLFFNVPARRKFLRSEATESFHLTNLVTHYALAHPEIAFVLKNNGREALRVAPAADLRERAYQIFGGEFIENLLEVRGGNEAVARVRGFVSAPRERRSSRDAQYLFVNGRFVRDRLISRSLSEGYRAVLPHGVYPAALLFLDVPLEEVDVNVHPAKTEVRFRRAPAVADTVRETVRAALASAGFFRQPVEIRQMAAGEPDYGEPDSARLQPAADAFSPRAAAVATIHDSERHAQVRRSNDEESQPAIDFGFTPPESGYDSLPRERVEAALPLPVMQQSERASIELPLGALESTGESLADSRIESSSVRLPPLVSAVNLVREVSVESLSTNIRPIGQLEESFIIATDPEGLLLIDQHVAHERILFDKYHALEGKRSVASQNLLMPETFDLSPAQAAAFETLATDLEAYGFELMRLSGRTVAIRAVPADLPASEARNMLSELLDTIDGEKRGTARETLRDEIAASLACRAAIKINTPLAIEKMQWLIDRLLTTSSPTTCPHGRPVILRLTTRDIERGFHRS